MTFSKVYISKLRFRLHLRHINNFCGWGGGGGGGGGGCGCGGCCYVYCGCHSSIRRYYVFTD
jgi:hypothetical protein